MTRSGLTAAAAVKAVAAAVLSVVTACAPGPGTSQAPSPAESLTIYGAASLKGPLAAAEVAYEAARPGTTLVVATDSSSRLRTQIEEGAPADVFLSADQANPLRLVESGLADGSAVDFAGNVLAIIVPADNPAGIGTPADLAVPGVRVIAAGDEVPITTYARRAVANLATSTTYPGDYVERYEANVVSREENVNGVVAKIELGEGDAAIVYLTDALAASNVKVIEIPASANVGIRYSGVVVRTSPRIEAAHAFLDWLAGPDGAAILADFGFGAPG